uniref:Secreted protein n=1 Tax=Taenia asiatica TaxID=60517 RepID=A0A0R3WHE9_TAEAS
LQHRRLSMTTTTATATATATISNSTTMASQNRRVVPFHEWALVVSRVEATLQPTLSVMSTNKLPPPVHQLHRLFPLPPHILAVKVPQLDLVKGHETA